MVDLEPVHITFPIPFIIEDSVAQSLVLFYAFYTSSFSATELTYSCRLSSAVLTVTPALWGTIATPPILLTFTAIVVVSL